MLGYEHETALERFGARVALKTLVGGVPVLVIIGDLTLLNTNTLATRGAVLHVNLLETLATVGLGRLHEVALTTQQLVAVEAGEVGHVPGATLSLRTLVGEDDLVAGRTPRLVELGVVTTTVDLAVGGVMKIDEIDQQLRARGARETVGMPALVHTAGVAG